MVIGEQKIPNFKLRGRVKKGLEKFFDRSIRFGKKKNFVIDAYTALFKYL